MTTLWLPDYVNDLDTVVARAIDEDQGRQDWTALLTDNAPARAQVISRESAVVCGRAWVDATFRHLSAAVSVEWAVEDGDDVSADTVLFTLSGPARALLTGERTALNFLQTLSGTATRTRAFVNAVRGTEAHIVDTRKTLPGLRTAQKYAVRCGGGHNHRIGLFDGILIKENHIRAANGIANAIAAARALDADVPLMTEAENLDEAHMALAHDVDVLLVDDFSLADLRTAVELTRQHRAAGGCTLLEYSGGASLANVREIAETGVDRISIGSLTKHVQAVDLSMRFL
jgi:nicotinate-nucleotide pyrophosphorylase (carboxylating)